MTVAVQAIPRAQLRRWPVALALSIGLAEITLGLWLTWNSAWPPPDASVGTEQAVRGVVSVLWLLAALTAYRRDPRGQLWVLLAAYVGVDWLMWVLQHIQNPWAFDLGNTFYAMPTAILVHAVVAFPSGRLRSRADRVLVAGVYAFTFGTALLSRITDDTYWCYPFVPCVTNPFFIWKNDALNGAVGTISAVAIPIIGLVVVATVLVHWRGAGPAARRALAPVLLTLPLAYLSNVVGYVGDNLGVGWLSELGRQPIFIASNAIVPVGLFVGIARSRLGRARIADLAVALGGGVQLGGLRDVLAHALADPTLELVFPATQDIGYVDQAGQAVQLPDTDARRAVTPIKADGRTLAVLIHDPGIDAEDPGLVAAVGSVARLALENERLAAEVRAQLEEVRASRARIVEAGDVERRKVERDLHDGAQQRLVALTMHLEQARATAVGSAQLIDQVTAELREAVMEVRSLARGLHPPILTEAGLAAAVDSLAERTPIPVDVDVIGGRLPQNVEATAYFVVAEGITNIARYAGASTSRVRAWVDAGRLVVTIADDGRGGADLSRGSGLRGLADRVSAAGGELSIDSPPGGGTVIRAEIPIQ